eukprot:scaffold16471_cov112-Isochrysis_galbana.AAC.2
MFASSPCFSEPVSAAFRSLPRPCCVLSLPVLHRQLPAGTTPGHLHALLRSRLRPQSPSWAAL